MYRLKDKVAIVTGSSSVSNSALQFLIVLRSAGAGCFSP